MALPPSHTQSGIPTRAPGPAGTLVLILVWLLPAFACLALQGWQAAKPPLETILSLAGIILSFLVLGLHLGRSLTHRILACTSQFKLRTGRILTGRLGGLVVWLLPATGLGLWQCAPAIGLPALVASCLLCGAAALAFLVHKLSRPQIWLAHQMVLGDRVISYGEMESIIQIPWQGFDIRLRKSSKVLEIRRPRQDVTALLQALSPVLTPYGVLLKPSI